MWRQAILYPDSDDSWTWAGEAVAGIPAIVRVLVALYRAGIEQVSLPADARSVRAIVELWQKKKEMPGLLWETGGAPDSCACRSTVLSVQGGMVFDPALVQWFQKAAAASPGESICVTGRDGEPILAICRQGEKKNQSLSRGFPRTVCFQTPDSAVSAPDGIFHRSVKDLQINGSGRGLLEMMGKPDEAGHVKWTRDMTFPLIRLLSRTGITPNQLTWLGFFFGLLGAYFIAAGGYRGGVIGAFCFWLSFMLDGLDGTLARLTYSESPFGEKLDTVLGHLTNIAFFTAVVWAVYGSESLLKAGAFMFFTVGSILFAKQVCEAETRLRDRTPRAPRNKRLQIFLSRINGRDFSVLVFLFAVFDGFNWFLWGSLAGIQVFWLSHYWLLTRHRKRLKADGFR